MAQFLSFAGGVAFATLGTVLCHNALWARAHSVSTGISALADDVPGLLRSDLFEIPALIPSVHEVVMEAARTPVVEPALATAKYYWNNAVLDATRTLGKQLAGASSAEPPKTA